MQRSKLRVKFRGSTAVPRRVVNTKPVSTQRTTDTLPVGLLLSLAEPQRGNAQIEERQRGFRGLGLDLAAKQLVTDPLDLLADIEIGGAEVDQIQGQQRTSPLRRPMTRTRTKAA